MQLNHRKNDETQAKSNRALRFAEAASIFHLFQFYFGLIAINEHGMQLIANAIKIKHSENRSHSMSLAQPRVEYVNRFTVTGFSVRTQNSIEFDKNKAKLPGFWQEFNVNHPKIDETVFGVYSEYESDTNGLYTVTAGFVRQYDNQALSSVSINPGKYLVFEGKGVMPEVVIDTWQAVWNYFTADSPYKRCFMTDFEAYRHGDEVAIYIGIE